MENSPGFSFLPGPQRIYLGDGRPINCSRFIYALGGYGHFLSRCSQWPRPELLLSALLSLAGPNHGYSEV